MARPQVMGVLNVTPDSFSDGGRYLDPEAAVAHGLAMAAGGADVVDVGGESSRPGALPVPVAEERARVVPVVEALASHVRVSVDTMKEEVAAAALGAGASVVNDVSARLWPLAAEAGAGYVLVHMQGTPATMQLDPRYDDVVGEVFGFLLRRAEQAAAAGVAELWVDPGIGFGKTLEHNLALLRHLPQLVDAGWPVLVGTSRKGFIGRLAPRPDGSPAPVDRRLAGSLATATWAMLCGAAMVRVHDVAPTVHAAVLVGDRRLGPGAPRAQAAGAPARLAGGPGGGGPR
jgi:dihydropteroate synthase